MRMRSCNLVWVAACAALVLSSATVRAETIESWENGLDGWSVPTGNNPQTGANAFNPTQGFTNGTGVTDGTTAITVTGAGPSGPNYGQMFVGPDSPATPVNPGDPPTLAQMLSIAQSVSFDVYTPPASFGYYLQFDVDINNNNTGYISLEGYGYPGTTIGSETTITVPVTPAIRAALAASTSTTTMIIQVGGGFTSGNETFTLDNIRTVVATTPGTYTWNKDAAGTWVTNPAPLATTATSNWDLAATPNQAGTTVVLGPVITANRTVTLDGAQTVGHIVFNNANAAYNIAPGNSGSLTLDNSSIDLGRGNFTTPTGTVGLADITVMAGNHTISAPITLANGVSISPAAGTSLTMSGGIGGTGPLTVADAGKVILTAPASYTGNTNVNAGTLQIAGLAGAGNVIVASGGTLAGSGSINGSLSVLSGGAVDMRTVPGTVDTLSPAGLTINSGSSLGFDIGSTADSIADSGAYTFSGSGTAAISLGLINGFHAGDFTLISNATGISLGQFSLPSNAIAGFMSTLQLSGNNLQVHLVATAPLTAFWRGGRVAGSPSVWTATNGSTNWDTSQTSNTDSGLPSTPTSVVFAANAGTAANMANTTLGADLTINSLEIKTSNPVGIGGANTLTVNNGITVDSGAGTTTISSGVGLGLAQTWANNSANKMTVSGAVSGGPTAGMEVNGTGRIRLTGNNTYSGGTTLTSGTLEVGSDHGLGPAGSNVAQNGGTIEIDPGVSPVWSLTGSQGSQTIKALAGIDPTLTIQTAGAQHTYGGSIQNGTGMVGVVISGTGLQILTNANTYSGGTTINAGATLQLGDGMGNTGSIVGNVTTNGTLTFAGDGTASPGTGDQTFAGNIDGSGGVTSINAGTVTLNGNNSYTGTTTISAGKLVAGSATAIGNANLTIGAGATLDVNGKSLTVKALTGTSTSNAVAATITNNDPGTGTATLNVTNGGQFGGAITDGPSAKTALLVSSGTLILTSVAPNTYGGSPGVSTFSGGVTVMPGATLQIGNGNGGQGQSQNPFAASPVLGASSNVVNVGGGASMSTLAFQWQGGGGVSNYFLANPINLNGNTLFLETEGNAHYFGPIAINGTGNTLQVRYNNKDVSLDGPISGSGTITARGLDVAGDGYSGGGQLLIATQTGTLGAVDNSGFTGTIALDETSPLGTPSANFSGMQLVIGDSAGLPNGTVAVSGGNYNAMANIGGTGVINVGYQGNTGTIAFAAFVTSPAIGALSSTSGGDFQLTDVFGNPVALTLGTNSATTSSFGGVISDTVGSSGGSITKIGTDTQVFTGVNTYSGSTTIQHGTLALGVANSISNTSAVILAGGKLSTGGFVQNFTSSAAPATLQLNASSAIDLGLGGQPGGGLVHFSASNGANGISWGTSTLMIDNWTPGIDHLVFGSNGSGLDPSQISDITFADFGAAKITATGEIVPVAVVPSFVLGDVNGDGHFNVADISAEMAALTNVNAYKSNYGPGHLVLNTDELFAVLDQNHDGLINNADIEAAIASLANTGGVGTGSSQLTAVPEPASLVLLALGGLLLIGQRLRGRKCGSQAKYRDVMEPTLK